MEILVFEEHCIVGLWGTQVLLGCGNHLQCWALGNIRSVLRGTLAVVCWREHCQCWSVGDISSVGIVGLWGISSVLGFEKRQKWYGEGNIKRFGCVAEMQIFLRHVSCVTCHKLASRVTYHLSPVTSANSHSHRPFP